MENPIQHLLRALDTDITLEYHPDANTAKRILTSVNLESYIEKVSSGLPDIPEEHRGFFEYMLLHVGIVRAHLDADPSTAEKLVLTILERYDADKKTPNMAWDEQMIFPAPLFRAVQLKNEKIFRELLARFHLGIMQPPRYLGPISPGLGCTLLDWTVRHNFGIEILLEAIAAHSTETPPHVEEAFDAAVVTPETNNKSRLQFGPLTFPEEVEAQIAAMEVEIAKKTEEKGETYTPQEKGEFKTYSLTEYIQMAGHDGWTPIASAAGRKRCYLVRQLAELGGDVNAPLKNGSTPLILATQAGSLSTVRTLLSLGAKLNCVDDMTGTALHYACQSPDLEILTALMEAGSNPNLMNNKSMTPYMILKKTPKATPEMLSLLESAGAIDPTPVGIPGADFDDIPEETEAETEPVKTEGEEVDESEVKASVEKTDTDAVKSE